MAAPIADLGDVVFAIPPIARRLNRQLRQSGAAEHELGVIFEHNQQAMLSELGARFTPQFRQQALVTLADGSMPTMDPIIHEIWTSMVDTVDRHAMRARRERRPEVPDVREVMPTSSYGYVASRRSSKHN